MGAEGEFLIVAMDYIEVLVLVVPAQVLSYAFYGMLNSQGDTRSLRDSMIAGFLVNLLLDPLFLYGWGPIPG